MKFISKCQYFEFAIDALPNRSISSELLLMTFWLNHANNRGKVVPPFFCFPSDKKWCSSTDNRGIKIREELKTNTRSFKSQFVAPQIASVASGNWVLWKLAEDEEEEEGAIAFGRRRVKTKRRESIWVKIVWFLWMFYGLESGAALGAATKFLLSFNYLWHLWRWPC